MKGVPLIRRPAKWTLNKLASLLAQHDITDLNSGLRVFRREPLEQLCTALAGCFFIHHNHYPVHAGIGPMRVSYLPIVYGKRVGPVEDPRLPISGSFMFLVFRLTVYFQPLRVFLPAGMVLFVMGFLKAIYDVYIDNLSETAVLGLLGAVLLWALGLLADMIARLHLRPPADPAAK